MKLPSQAGREGITPPAWLPSLSPLVLRDSTASLPFTPCLGGQHILTLRRVEMAAGMWAGKKKERKKKENLEACPNLLMFILEPVSDIRAGRV